MPDTQQKFHSAKGKRLILIAEDEMINREILCAMLESEYEILQACNGEEAMRMIREQKDTISLVLLDIQMPVMSGFDVLKAVRADDEISRIPLIVVTTDKEAEVESLKLGAVDFIPKPYPDVDVVRARLQRTIELYEDRNTIQFTERDTLTGLLNREFFYHYAEQYDLFHAHEEMDAIFLDVNHFHMINERYGKSYGDDVLCKIGERVKELVRDSGGIVCRRVADNFMVYCPHREDYQELLESASIGLAGGAAGNNRIRLRMGIYPCVDKSIDMERRFDRAKRASDSVRGSLARPIGIYDKTLHERELYAEQLIEDFPEAIEKKQFTVYYQPKFDVRPETPLLAGAEALVRWIHPQLGFINPGVFIPLFEENGLIQKLDLYVWRETARQIKAWKDEMDFSIPISVNLSRIDFFEPNLVDTLKALLQEFDLSGRDLKLEVTESAYTQDSEIIIETVEQLRELGFQIEMDDFGTGYSSLNMVSSLPIDALKLDMQFIRNAFKPGGNTHMLEIIIDIADYLSVPVIAEGVETEKQLNALRDMGCAMVQGYFFSKPVPAEDFEPFIRQSKEAKKAEAKMAKRPENKSISIHRPNPAEEAEQKKKTEQEQKSEEETEQESGKGIPLRIATAVFAILAFLAAIVLSYADLSVTKGYRRMEEASDRHIAAQMVASDMETGSDYLTDRVRCFVVTGEPEYLQDFLEEVNVTRRRDLAVENLEQLLKGEDHSALTSLNTALSLSNKLLETEYLAIRLIAETEDYPQDLLPETIAGLEIPEQYRNMSESEMREQARTLVFDHNYMQQKDQIRENVRMCTQALLQTSSQKLERASERMELLVHIQTGLTALYLLIVLGIVFVISGQIRKPLTKMVEKMRAQELIRPEGAEELRFVTRTYNTILKETRKARERLSHEASHDALTGLFNRGAYDMLMESVDKAHMALLIIDVDHFKSVNDTYGHAVGDRVLKRVAEILQNSFRSVDIICRIGGDEFVVIMTRSNSSMQQIVENKIKRANYLLRHPKDDLPPVSLSVGVAFSDRENPNGDIFADADAALYRVKESGRNGCAFY